MTMAAEEEVLVFGRHALRLRARILLSDGRRVELGARAFDLIAVLATAEGELVTKDQLMQQVWRGAIVDENNLHAQISAIRRAFGEDRDVVITVPGRGYRLGLPVSRRVAPAGTPSRGSPQRPVILILPLQPIGGDASVTLAQGVTDSLTTDLSRLLPAGAVAARATAGAYRDRALTVREIGEEIGVRYVLEGSVAVHPGRIRVNAQLIDAAMDTHLWAERFDQAEDEGALAAQDAIVARLARLGAVQVALAEARRTGGGPAAMVLQAQGRAFASRLSPEAAATCRHLFARALELDADNPDAGAGLAAVEAYSVVNGYVPGAEKEARLAVATSLADRVLAANPEHLVALRARGVALRAQGRIADALVAAEAVLARCPGDPPACREVGLCRFYLGETEAAIEWFRQAERSGPGDPARWSWLQGLGRALLHAGRDAEAVAVLRMLVECHPGWPFGHGLLAVALAGCGDMDAARERHAEFLRLAPGREARLPDRLVPVPAERLAPAYREGDARLRQRFAELETRFQPDAPLR